MINRYILLTLLVIQTISTIGQTRWTESDLKTYWKSNQMLDVEGIYETERCYEERIGIIRNGDTFFVIYLNGDPYYKSKGWTEGDILGELIPTANKYRFKSRIKETEKSKGYHEDFIFEFGNGELVRAQTYNDFKCSYLKVFPSAYDKVTASKNSASGTGFAITSTGVIVTNYHVIENASSIKVKGVNGNFNTSLTAKIILSDKNNDLALLQIDDSNFKSTGNIPFTVKSELASVGENVFVLGYPLRTTMGDEIKLTNGIISSRTGFQGEISSYQISAPIQPGNSGGPLFDNNGNLIGIINAKHIGAENVSYAVKTPYLNSLIESAPNQLNLSTTNILSGKPLTKQVELLKNLVYIIEIEN